jgi:hydroxypyruvate reductase
VPAVTNVDTAAARSLLRQLYRVAVDSVDGARVLANYATVRDGEWRFERGGRALYLSLPTPASGGRLRLIGLGKAAAALMEGALASLSEAFPPDDALLIVPAAAEAQARRLPGRVTVCIGDHPLPGIASEAAGRALIEFIGTPRAVDRYLVMLSGGASALCAVPKAGLTLADKQLATERTMRAGAPIEELNALRRALSEIKGGGLARRLAPAQFVTVAISDVRGDDPAVIGSGPTVECVHEPLRIVPTLQARGVWERLPPAVQLILQQPTPALAAAQPTRYAVIASLDDALEAVRVEAERHAITVQSLGRTLYQSTTVHAADLGQRLRAEPHTDEWPPGPAGSGSRRTLWLGGGEPTVALRGEGRGGRAQHLALQVAEHIAGLASVCLLAAGTDGRDGPTDAAGGFADGGTWERIRAAGADPTALLANDDSHTALALAGDLFRTEATATNVADLVMAIAGYR